MPNKKKTVHYKKYKMTAAYALNGHLARTHTHARKHTHTSAAVSWNFDFL